METREYNTPLELWGMVEGKNELGETIREPGKIKNVWCKVIPTSGNVNTIPNTEIKYSNVTHKIRCRKLSVKNPKVNMFFKDKEGNKYDAEYFQRDFKNNEFLEFLTKIIYE